MERSPALLDGRTKLWIILIVVCLVLVPVTYYLVSYASMPRQYGNIGGPLFIAIDSYRLDHNWSLSVRGASPGLALSATTLTIGNFSSRIIIAPMDSVPILNLDLTNWSTYHALFAKVGLENNVTAGDKILIDINAYPGELYFVFKTNAKVVGDGSLR